MKKTHAAGLVVAMMMLLAGGCKSKHEKLISNQIDLMNKLADELATIKTNTDVVDAKPKLERLGAELRDARKAAADAGEPTAQENQKLKDEYKSSLERAMARLQDEMKRIQKDVGFEAVAKIGETLQFPVGSMDDFK